MHYAIAFAVTIIGSMVAGEDGLFYGALLGFGGALLWQQRKQLRELQARVEGLAAAVGAATEPTPAAAASPQDSRSETTPTAAPAPAPMRPLPELAPRPREPSAIEASINNAVDAFKHWLTSGNMVVRVGVVVLFFGVAFLLRYAYEQALLPVELRLTGAALGGIVLVMAGWRLRHRSDAYGTVLQGAGVGILYLTIFAAARLYELIPLSAAFGLLLALVAASSVLAVLQNAQSLAIFSMSGGFLAPVLVSTGAGSHVALFSYYALLNGGILAMAWFKHWRWLNWVGFLFTFAIGATWGYQYYKPEFFATTEPFVVLFFFYYVGISVLFARRQGVELRGLVDGTLVFGTPIIAFSLQAGLVREAPFGLAFSALAAAAVYTVLALWLRRRGAFTDLLGQSFVALAVVFATLAIPFAFDDQRFTAASWALEGAGLVWIGLRQAQKLPRAFGVLLQLAAAGAFIVEIGSAVEPRLVLNSAYLGAVMLSLAAGFTAYVLNAHRDNLHRFEVALMWVFLAFSVAWWLAGGIREISNFHPPWYGRFDANNVQENLFVLFVAITAAGWTFIARRLTWRAALTPGFLLLPLLLVGAFMVASSAIDNPLPDFGWVAWPAGFGALAWHLRHATGFGHIERFWHAGFAWAAIGFVAWVLYGAIDTLLPNSIWAALSWGAVPTAATFALLKFRMRETWPLTAHRDSYVGWGMAVIALYLAAWVLGTGLVAGDPAPLPFVTIANPLELTQLGTLLAIAAWSRTVPTQWATIVRSGLGGVAFAWLNMAAARAVHFYTDAPYPVDRIMDTDAFQSAASILWTLTALALMGFGARRSMRASWIVGAVLLGVVTVKLFTIDLANLEIVARIISFITVGLLILVIGYFAPLPPARPEEARA
jgi:uncharacterized membrane protein